MPNILKGPVAIEQVAELLESIKKAWYAQNRRSYKLKTDFVYWEPSSIVYPNRSLPDVDSLNSLYQDVNDKGLLSQVSANSDKFGITVCAEYGGDLELETQVVDVTLLEDILKGQTFPAAVERYAITTYNHYLGRSNWESFATYRTEMVRQAQQRVNQQIVKAAFHMIKDLRGL